MLILSTAQSFSIKREHYQNRYTLRKRGLEYSALNGTGGKGAEGEYSSEERLTSLVFSSYAVLIDFPLTSHLQSVYTRAGRQCDRRDA